MFIEVLYQMIKKQSKPDSKIKCTNKMAKIEQSDKIYLLIHGVLLIQAKK